MENEIFKPPVTNRGVENTTAPNVREILKSYILVDWIQFTIFTEDNFLDLFCDIFKLDREDILYQQGGLFSYNFTYYYKNIKMFINTNRNDMGVHFLLSGQACRDYEDLGYGYDYLFNKILSYGARFTRIDVSCDIFDSNLFTVNKIVDCIRNNEVNSRFRHSVEFTKTNLATNLNDGLTIWFGSRASKIQIVFYDKLKERLNNDVLVDSDVKFWNRLECRFRDDYANIIVDHIVHSENFEKYYFSVVNNYISFVNYDSSDSNRSRWTIKTWWQDFLGSSDKIRLSNVNVEKTITRIDNWIIKSVSRSLFMLYLANYSKEIDSFDNYITYLKKGYIKIHPNDLLFINDYRQSKGLDSLNTDQVFAIVNSELYK